MLSAKMVAILPQCVDCILDTHEYTRYYKAIKFSWKYGNTLRSLYRPSLTRGYLAGDRPNIYSNHDFYLFLLW